MSEDRLLTLQEVANLLAVSSRSVRRYVQRGQLSARYETTPKGRELRFPESEVKELLQDMAKSRPHSSGQPMDKGQNADRMFTGTLDIRDFFNRYEKLVGQLGYFQAKAEETKLLTERVESLAKVNQELGSRLTAREAELIEHQAAMSGLTKAKGELERDLATQRQKARTNSWIALLLVLLALLVGFGLSAPTVDRISRLLNGP